MQANPAIKADQDLASHPGRGHLFQSFPLFHNWEIDVKAEIMQQPGPLQSKDGFCACLSGENPLNGPLLEANSSHGKIK